MNIPYEELLAEIRALRKENAELRERVSQLEEQLKLNSKNSSKPPSTEDLLGICLGYGEKNAELFQKMVTLLTSMGKLDFTLEKPSPERLKNLKDELAVLKRSFTGGIHTPVSRKFFFNIGLGFRANFSDPETLFLQKKYAELHKKLTQAYEGATFLEKTLELICIADDAGI
jgi:hypothetical protein